MSFLDQIVTAAEAARHCNVPRSQIDHWRRAGRLEPIGRHGRSLLYRLHDVVDADAQAAAHPLSHRKERAIPGFPEVA
jgi:hypothetical protein